VATIVVVLRVADIGAPLAKVSPRKGVSALDRDVREADLAE
jgi:hypothetical protein